MANYSQTVLLNALAELSDPANKDLRTPAGNYGATNAFNKYKKNVIMNYDEFNRAKNQSELQTKQIDYLIRNTKSVTNARAASLTGQAGDSLRDTITFVTYAREFTISDGLIRNNTIGAQKMLVAQMRNARLDLGAAIETAAVAKLEAFKNTVSKTATSGVIGTWDATNYVLEIAKADQDLYWNYISTDMKNLDFNGQYQSIHNNNANALINRQVAQGAGNSANLTYQFPEFEFETSNTVSNLSDYFTTGYVVPAGSIGLVDWIPQINREGLVNHAEWDFTSMADPFGVFDNIAVAVQKKVVNGTTTSGTQDAQWIYELSVDVAFYIPTITTYKLVQKYGLLKS